MTTLAEYLTHKHDAFRALRSRALSPGYAPVALRAHVTAEGRSGVRRIRLRDHQVLADSPRDFVGYDLGPSSPELALGALGSCLTHSYLIQAAAQGVALDRLEVEVTGQIDQRAGEAGYEAVERLCPVLNLLRRPQAVSGPARRTAAPNTARAFSPEGVA